MARTQAADYEERRDSILDKAAKLIAERGFLGASMADLAKACKTSKSLLYHYYPSKEAILFALMDQHLESLWLACKSTLATPRPAAEQLRALTHSFMEHYVGAAHRQSVLVSALGYLPIAQGKKIIARERQLISTVESILSQLNPRLAAHHQLLPATMLYFGLINWTHVWYDPKGKVSPDILADMAVDMALNGIASLQPS